MRTGVAGGVLSTLVTGTAATASAEEPVAATVEMPTVTAALSSTVEESAAATRQAAQDYELRAAEQEAAQEARKAAAEKAKVLAAKRKAEAERKAEEARRAEAAQEAQERASRTAERSDLSTASTAASGSTASLVDFLQAQVGKAYVLGATGPSAYDCSSLTQAAFRTIGVDLPRVSQDQSTVGTPVSMESLQAGDLLFWGGTGSAYHVAVYVGGGQYIDAANPEKGVVKQNVSDWPPDSARRVL